MERYPFGRFVDSALYGKNVMLFSSRNGPPLYIDGRWLSTTHSSVAHQQKIDQDGNLQSTLADIPYNARLTASELLGPNFRSRLSRRPRLGSLKFKHERLNRTDVAPIVPFIEVKSDVPIHLKVELGYAPGDLYEEGQWSGKLLEPDSLVTRTTYSIGGFLDFNCPLYQQRLPDEKFPLDYKFHHEYEELFDIESKDRRVPLYQNYPRVTEMFQEVHPPKFPMIWGRIESGSYPYAPGYVSIPGITYYESSKKPKVLPIVLDKEHPYRMIEIALVKGTEMAVRKNREQQVFYHPQTSEIYSLFSCMLVKKD